MGQIASINGFTILALALKGSQRESGFVLFARKYLHNFCSIITIKIKNKLILITGRLMITTPTFKKPLFYLW